MKQINILKFFTLTCLIALLICWAGVAGVFGQTTITQKRVFTYDLNPSVTPPTWSSKFVTGDWCLYTKDSSIYLYNAVTKKWSLGLNGKNKGGGTGIATTVINTNGELVIYYTDGLVDNVGRVVGLDGKDGAKGDKGDKGDTGPTGPQGPPGTGVGSGSVFINFPVFIQSPEYYKPAHANKTFSQQYGSNAQKYIDTAFAGVFKTAGALITDQIDWACVQAAVNSMPTGSRYVGYGTYYINKSIYVSPFRSLKFSEGIYKTTNSNAFAIFYRENPTDGNTAMQRTDYDVHFEHMQFYGGDSQTGINVSCSYNATYESCRFFDLGDAIIATFQINASVKNCLFTGILRGVTLGWVPGLSPATYQSNQVSLYHCQFSGRKLVNGGSQYAVKTDQVSGIELWYCIIEGFSWQRGIWQVNANSTVVKDLKDTGGHCEAVEGFTVAYIETDMREGNIIKDGGWGQYPALMVKATSTAGTVHVKVMNVPYWVGRADGKSFESNGCQWTFEDNNGAFFDKGQVLSQFVGNNVQECGGDRCGTNKLKFIGIPGSKSTSTTAARIANISGNGLSRAFNPWLDKLPEGVELKQMEVGESEFNGKPSKKLVLVYIQSGMELFRSPEYPNYVAGYNAYVTEVAERNGYNFGEWPVVN